MSGTELREFTPPARSNNAVRGNAGVSGAAARQSRSPPDWQIAAPVIPHFRLSHGGWLPPHEIPMSVCTTPDVKRPEREWNKEAQAALQKEWGKLHACGPCCQHNTALLCGSLGHAKRQVGKTAPRRPRESHPQPLPIPCLAMLCPASKP